MVREGGVGVGGVSVYVQCHFRAGRGEREEAKKVIAEKTHRSEPQLTTHSVTHKRYASRCSTRCSTNLLLKEEAYCCMACCSLS